MGIAGQADKILTERHSVATVTDFGLSLIEETEKWAVKRSLAVGCRVGLHTGECIGGIVGADMQRYHLFGALMTTVELLESTAPNGCVQASAAVRAAYEAQVMTGSLTYTMRPSGESFVQEHPIIFFERAGPQLATSKGTS